MCVGGREKRRVREIVDESGDDRALSTSVHPLPFVTLSSTPLSAFLSGRSKDACPASPVVRCLAVELQCYSGNPRAKDVGPLRPVPLSFVPLSRWNGGGVPSRSYLYVWKDSRLISTGSESATSEDVPAVLTHARRGAKDGSSHPSPPRAPQRGCTTGATRDALRVRGDACRAVLRAVAGPDGGTTPGRRTPRPGEIAAAT